MKFLFALPCGTVSPVTSARGIPFRSYAGYSRAGHFPASAGRQDLARRRRLPKPARLLRCASKWNHTKDMDGACPVIRLSNGIIGYES